MAWTSAAACCSAGGSATCMGDAGCSWPDWPCSAPAPPRRGSPPTPGPPARAAAGFAPSLETLVAARVVQGLGAAAAVPASLALIGSLFPPGRERTRALSLLAATTSAGVISGLLAGGVLTGVLGWRWVFLALAPLALGAAATARALVPEARAEPPVPAPDVP